MLDKITKMLEENWKLVVIGIGGVVFGAVFFSQKSNGGISVIPDNGGVTITKTVQNPLPKDLDINDQWAYVAETNAQDATFSEDGCRKRYGTVNINQKSNSTELILTGERKVKEGCSSKDAKSNQEVIRWGSEYAVVSVNEKKLIVWFKTHDAVPRFGYISASLIKKATETKPSRIQGEMYYLDNSTNKWFKAKIDFYPLSSPEGSNIAKKW
ncbi:hypothetical protein RIVM261_076030 [Rivularia sp. IAM M-261]|nr:hypothetical protein RIVM261_076030 [Rivularia sp. IAM M-261]